MTPIDPQILQLCQRQAELGLPAFPDIGADAARDITREVFRWRNRRISSGDVVSTVANGHVDTPGGVLPSRTYQPAGPPLAHIVYFHGGGFVVGDLDVSEAHCRALASRIPAVVTSLTYRLAPEHPFPAAIDDCAAGLAAVADHVDLPLVVAGDSAGGYLALAAACRNREADHDRLAASVHALLLLYPMLDPSMSSASMRASEPEFLVSRRSIGWFWDAFLGGPERPLDMGTLPLPPQDISRTLVVIAGHDPFRDEARHYAREASSSGRRVTLLEYPTMPHGFFGLGAHSDAADSAITEICDSLRQVAIH